MNRRDAAFGLVALLAAPLARAQSQAQLPRIALVDPAEVPANMAEGADPMWSALLGELRRLGHIERQTVSVDRWSGGGAGTAAGYAALAGKVVASQPRVIVVRGRTMLSHVAAVTKKLPIVAIGTIPAELRASLARPGGNVTGIIISFDAMQLYSKQVQILRDVLRPRARIAWLGPRFVWESFAGVAARKGAVAASVTLQPVFVPSPVNKAAIRRAFADIAKMKVDGVLVSPASELFPFRSTIAELLAVQKLPGLGANRYWPEAGVMLGYGGDAEEYYRRGAHYVDQILKGVDPAVIPIEQPTKVDLVINLETARALGLTIPQSVLMRADKVIE
jgi:putative ABC transport system substrate-binding protein